MERLTTRYIAWVSHRAGMFTLLFAIILAAEIGFLSGHFRLDTDLKALFSGGNETVRDLEYLESRIGTSSNVQVVVRSDSFENNVRFLSDLRDRVSDDKRVRFVELERDIAYLEERALLLVPLGELEEAEQKVKEVIGREIERGLSLDAKDADAASPEKGLEAELDRIVERIEASKKRYDISRYFTADGGRYVEMKVRPAGRDTDLSTIREMISFLDGEVAALRPERYGVEVEVGGYYRHRIREVEEIRGNIVETIGLCVVLLVALMVFLFRTLRAVIVIFFPLSLGVVSGIVAVQYLVGEFNLISAFSFAMRLPEQRCRQCNLHKSAANNADKPVRRNLHAR